MHFYGPVQESTQSFKAATFTISSAAPSGVAAGRKIKTSAESFWTDLWLS